jgi:hypothetical protein
MREAKDELFEKVKLVYTIKKFDVVDEFSGARFSDLNTFLLLPNNVFGLDLANEIYVI